MSAWKLPPIAKVYEAFTAVADGRVRVSEAGRAEVESSARDKAYVVEWRDEGETISAVSANDNASYWQGYLGYPILAVLMTLGSLRYDEDAAAALRGVPWNEVNRRFRRDYEAAVDHVLGGLPAGGPSGDEVRAAADAVMDQLRGLELERLGRGARPPKAGGHPHDD